MFVIIEIWFYYNFHRGVNPNDIALLELDEPLVLNDRVQPVKLPAKDAIPSGQSTLSGWGSMGGSLIPQMPEKLQTVDMPLIGYEGTKI